MENPYSSSECNNADMQCEATHYYYGVCIEADLTIVHQSRVEFAAENENGLCGEQTWCTYSDSSRPVILLT
jgi:hypothetical protein